MRFFAFQRRFLIVFFLTKFTPKSRFNFFVQLINYSKKEGETRNFELGDGSPYGVSKAAANAYTRHLALQFPDLIVNSCTPGWIDTKLTSTLRGDKTPAQVGMKTPEEATPAFLHLLFAKAVPWADIAETNPSELPALQKLAYDPKNGVNGWYYGSDGVRSPWHTYRGFGDLAYAPKDVHEGHKEPYYRNENDAKAGQE